ncbi:MAG: class IV adenylate cyclase [Acidobacteria bacterium]|nr:class IV adenylate cyclase [Acidobacteriota bacterium]
MEREIKLRFDSAADARAAVLATGAEPMHARRFQEDCLFDTDDEQLRRQRCALRIRSEGPRSVLTFKGPVQPGPVKIREELETVVADGEVLRAVLERLGLSVWFRYQKYREEFTHQDVVIAIDETPVGTFVEIEGPEEGIRSTAAAMTRGPGDYILESYHTLFVRNREILGFKGTDMVFDDPGRTT